MIHRKIIRDLIGQRAERKEVEKIRFEDAIGKIPVVFQPEFGDRTDIATCAVLKNKARHFAGSLSKCRQVGCIM